MKNVQISVYCLAYNCIKFIERSINGMLNQKINVNYKIIIHDDASSDGTADVIRKYADMYPEKICAILQSENQYSKGVHIYEQYIAPNIEGDYIAICEGDDYWTDENKLQLQYDYMKKHPECSLCVHNTEMCDLESNKRTKLNHWDRVHILTEEEIFVKYSVHTSSYFIRRSCKDWPGNYYWFGDLVMLTWAFYRGKVVALPKVMSVYNFNNPNGVMKRFYNSKKVIMEAEKKYFDEFDIETSYKYTKVIRKRCQMEDYSYLVGECNDKILHSLSKAESINAAKRIVMHEYYPQYINDQKGIKRLIIRYKYEGYFFYPLWKYIIKKYLKSRI